MMEQRNQMLRELRLNKKESMGVVSVIESENLPLSLCVVKMRTGTRTEEILMNSFLVRCRFYVFDILSVFFGKALAKENRWWIKLENCVEIVLLSHR